MNTQVFTVGVLLVLDKLSQYVRGTMTQGELLYDASTHVKSEWQFIYGWPM